MLHLQHPARLHCQYLYAAMLVWLCVEARLAGASVYYVRAGGSDSADGSTPASAFATIGHAAGRLGNPGDQVIVGPGTYAEGNIAPARSGINGHPMQFLADLDGTKTGDLPGSVMVLPPADGVQTAGFLIMGKHDVVIDGFTIVGAADAGIQVRSAPDGSANSRNVTIRNTVVRSSAKRGIDIAAIGAISVENTTAAENGSGGIVVQGCLLPSNLCRADVYGEVVPALTGNTSTMNGAEGIFVSGATGATLADNSVQDSGATGIGVRGSSQVSVQRNYVVRSQGSGIQVGVADEPVGQDLALQGNAVSESLAVGIDIFMAGTVDLAENSVTHSGSSGLSVQSGGNAMVLTASNNTIGVSGAHGMFVAGFDTGIVQNNVIVSNGDSGITLRAAANALVVNNLVYANSGDGLGIGTGGLGAPNPQIINNTVYRNGGWGLVIGSQGGDSPGGIVLDNIFHMNSGGGIAAGSFTCGYIAGFNINTDGYGQDTPRNAYDSLAPPTFVNPAGPDAILGGDGFADDDFRLRQILAGSNWNSAGVDAGFALTTDVGLTGSTATGGPADVGRIDIGYHYGATADQQIRVPTPYMPLFVRAVGNDAQSGLDPQHALASIREGAQRAQAGAMVVVGPGRYLEGDIHPKQNAGRTTFFADSSGTMTGDLPGVVLVDATGVDTGFVLLGSCHPVVDGFHVTGAMSAGIQVRSGSVGAQVRNNTAFSNLRRGIEILGVDEGEINNNLVYANGTGGIRVSSSINSNVLNNTVYGNGQVGILIGGSTVSEAAPGTWVLRNVVSHNTQGIRAEPNSFTGYLSGFNVAPDGFEANTPRADSDYVADPLLVNPSGIDAVLGGAGFVDDDFHLRQDADKFSSAVDIDFDQLNTLTAGSTRSDGRLDIGPLDAGYHYPLLPRAPLARPSGNVVFVRTAGDDGHDGRTAATAVATLRHALALVPGDGAIVIGPGTYNEQGLRLGGAGGTGGRLVLMADASGELSGDAAGAVILDAAGGRGPMIAGPVLIDGVTFTGANGIGLRILRKASDVTIRNSVVCGNAGAGISDMANGVNGINNLICNNGGVGLAVRLVRGRGLTEFLNNTIAGNRRAGVVIGELAAGASQLLLYNNIVSGNGGKGITVRTARRSVSRTGRNLNTDGYGPGTRPGLGDITLPPLFVGGEPNPAATNANVGDFRLLPASPAIDAGMSTAVEMGLGPRSATADGTPDAGPTDLGFHS